MTTRVWLPGGRGMLGTALIDAWRSRGAEVVVTDRELDITDAGAVHAFAAQTKPSHVVLLAAHTAVDLCESEVERAMLINGTGPGIVGAAARSVGAHALHISTDYVFSGTARTPYREDDTPAPLSVYGKSKRRGEETFLEAVGTHGAVVRTSWLYGPGGKNFVQTMLRLMAERDEVRVVADQHGRPTYTRDLAAVLVDAALNGAHGIVHFANAEATTWHAFAARIHSEALRRGLPVKAARVTAIATADYPTPAARPAWSVLDTTRVQRLLGVTPRPWTAALDAYLDEVQRGRG